MNLALEFLKKNIASTSTVVVAVSGGPDSMVLLSLILKLKEVLNLKIVVAHVNHKHRKESEEEAVMVKNYCLDNECPFEYMEITEYTDDNFHNYARIKRYDFFETCVNKYAANYLLTAHHGDDLIETILMRLTRGSSLKGYAGFSDVIEKDNYKILRPLVFYTKEEITNFAKDNKIPYRVDSSNNEDVYTRNRYRHYVLPFLKAEEKNVHRKFYKFSKLLLLYNKYILKEVKKIMADIYKDNVLNVSKFKSYDEIIQIKIIEEILNKYYGDDLMLISDVHTNSIHSILLSKKPNLRINLPNKYIAIKNYDTFKITKDLECEDYKLEFSGYLMLPNKKELKQVEGTDDDSNYTIRLNSKELKLPLYVRNRKNGDKILVKGLNGAKKIKDIFIDEKVSLSVRDVYPILVDGNDEIIWLPGLKKSKFSKQKGENYDIIIKYF